MAACRRMGNPRVLYVPRALLDLCHLRWDDGYFDAHIWGLRFFLEKRKNDQKYTGQWIDVARSAVAAISFGGFSAVDELRAARAACGGEAAVLRRLESTGKKGERRLSKRAFFPESYDPPELGGLPKCMARTSFQQFYQELLIAYCGISRPEAVGYTTHGIRRGAATRLVEHGVPVCAHHQGPRGSHVRRLGRNLRRNRPRAPARVLPRHRPLSPASRVK